MIFKLFTKLLHDRNRGHGRRVAQRTESTPQHVFRKILNVVDVFLDAATRVKAVQRLLQPVRAFAAGNTPATTLVLVELHDVLRETYHTGGIVDHDDAAGTEHGASLGDAIKIHRDVDFVGSQNRGRRSARHDSLNLFAARNAAAHFVNHLPQAVTKRQFVDAGFVHMAAEAEEAYAAVLGCSVVSKLLSAVEQNVRRAGERLNIIDDGGR